MTRQEISNRLKAITNELKQLERATDYQHGTANAPQHSEILESFWRGKAHGSIAAARGAVDTARIVFGVAYDIKDEQENDDAQESK